MKSVAEIEALARGAHDGHEKRIADIYECGRMEAIRTLEKLAACSTNDAYDLARAVLAMLPVVRAAEAHYDARGLGQTWAARSELHEAIDSFRRQLGGQDG